MSAYSSKESELSPVYRQWLDRDVAYIITKEEKSAFLNTTTDEERDAFIAHFWAIRNPDPGAPTNSYKDEVYRRIAYANQYFGSPGVNNGWKTAMGRIYITLGAPQQRAKYHQPQQTVPMEIWFYQNANPALPPYFYILFYKRDLASDFLLYRPYFDGPEKLTTSVNIQNDRAASLNAIDGELGREVARTTLSLIPDEPVDFANAVPSLSSDVMLAEIHDLANNPLTKDMLRRNSELLESVHSHIIVNGDYLEVLTGTFRDAVGQTNVHYALRFRQPEDFSISRDSKGKLFYSISVSARVFDTHKKLIFSQDRDLRDTVSQEEFEANKGSLFGYEGLLPLPPGEYNLDFLLTNNLTHTAYRAQRLLKIAPPLQTGLGMSSIIPFSSVEDTQRTGDSPFTISGVKFTPRPDQGLSLVQGENLKIMFQIWAPPADPTHLIGHKLKVEYAYGRLTMSGDAKTVKEEISREQFDRYGSLLSGKKIPTSDLSAGNYRLAVTVTDPESQAKTFSSLSFRVLPSGGSPVAWDVWDTGNPHEVRSSLDYERAQAYLAQGDQAAGQKYLDSAFQENPKNQLASSRLIALYNDEHDWARISAMCERIGNSKEIPEETLLQTAQALSKTGENARAIQMVESSLTARQASPALYLALASFYQAAGNATKAYELTQKANSMRNIN